MRQTLKASIISSLYVVAISYVIGDIKTMSDLYTTGSTALVMGYVLDRMSNVIMNSFMRTEVNQWAVILKQRSLDRTLHEVKIPFTNIILWKTPVSKAQWNQNVRSNSLNIMLRSPHLLGFPYGREVYFGSYFLVKYLTLKWAQWKHPDIAYKMRLKEKFDNINPLNIKFWKNIPTIIYSPVQVYQNKKSAKEIAEKTNEIIKSAATRPLNTCRLIFNFHTK